MTAEIVPDAGATLVVEQQEQLRALGLTDRLALAVSDELDRLLERVNKVLGRHVPYWTDNAGVRHDNLVQVPWDEAPEGHVCRIGVEFESCSQEDEEHWVLACSECRCLTDEGEVGHLLYPCMTRQLLIGRALPVGDRLKFDRATALGEALNVGDLGLDEESLAPPKRSPEAVEDPS